MRAMQGVLQWALKRQVPRWQQHAWAMARSNACGMQTAAADRVAGGTGSGKEPETALLQSIRQRIKETLTNPSAGFYMHRDVFGRSGDFITSPEVSQMFGEMISIWTLVTWMHMGKPKSLRLVELGPGRGTLMADLLRGASSFPEFASALEVGFVELSPAMRTKQWLSLKCSPLPAAEATAQQKQQQPAAQAEANPDRPSAVEGTDISRDEAASSPMSDAEPAHSRQPEQAWSDIGPGCKVHWHASLDAVPQEGAPAIYIAHEFFDALPVHQFVKDPARGWLEKMVDLADEPSVPSLPGLNIMDEAGLQSSLVGQDVSSSSGSTSTSAGSGASGSSRLESADAVSGIVRSSRSSHTPSSGESAALGTAAKADQGPSRPAHAQGQGQQDPHHLRLVLSPRPTPASALLVERRLAALGKEEAEKLTAIEIGAHSMATAEQLALRIGKHGGAALIIDYGRDRPYTDSLTAIRNHKGVHVLSQPGSADLSAWVDFSALRQGAEESGASVKVHGPVPQAQLLLSLGIQARLQALAELATEQQAEGLLAGYKRLVESGPDSMGSTYQALAIVQEDLPTCPGGPPIGFEPLEQMSDNSQGSQA